MQPYAEKNILVIDGNTIAAGLPATLWEREACDMTSAASPDSIYPHSLYPDSPSGACTCGPAMENPHIPKLLASELAYYTCKRQPGDRLAGRSQTLLEGFND